MRFFFFAMRFFFFAVPGKGFVQHVATAARCYRRAFTAATPPFSMVRGGHGNEALVSWIKDEDVRVYVLAILEQTDKRLEEKDERLKSLLEEKDKRLEEKDKSLKGLLEEKDKSLKGLLEEKDKLLEREDKSHKWLLEEKDERISLLEEKLLSLQGLLTARGVMEFFADGHLKRHVIGKRKRMSITDILREAASMAYMNPTAPDDIQLLKDAYEDCIVDVSQHNAQACQDFFVDLYGELSKAIHGSPWSGPGVKNTLLEVANAEQYICVVAQVCEKKFNLELEGKN